MRPQTERVILPYYNTETKKGIHPGEFRYVAGKPPGVVYLNPTRNIILKGRQLPWAT